MSEIPRENIIRAIQPGGALRTAADGSKTLHGYFARFGEWTEISSVSEGRFREQIAPGAFRKTFSENRQNMKVLFDHGHDPSIGNKPLGPIRTLEEDAEGARYEVDLLDTSYNRDLIPALERGLLGASFRFRVMREEIKDNVDPSDDNPHGLPERTIREAQVMEFGPVVFPAYAGATAGVRSLTDRMVLRRFVEQPAEFRAELEDLQSFLTRFVTAETEEGGGDDTPPTDDSAEPEVHPVSVRRSNAPLFGLHREEKPAWRL